MPDPAAAAIAADEIMATHLLRRPIDRAKRRGHALRILPQLLECHVPPRLDPGERFHRGLQHWLDLHLRDAHWRLARHASVIVFADEAPPFVDARIAESV